MAHEDIFDQSTVTEHGVQHNVAGRPIFLPLVDELDAGSEPVIRFNVAMIAVNAAHAEINQVKNDETLSNVGKAKKLDPRRERLLVEVANQVEGTHKFEEWLDLRESRFLSVPELHPQNAAEAMLDRELRDWWKEQDKGVRLDLLQKMNEAPGHERLEIAILRSPYAQLDVEAKLARDAWNKSRRIANPAEAEAIASARNQVEWSRRGLESITAISSLVSELGDKKVLDVLILNGQSIKTIQSFGFDAPSIERAKRMLKR